LVSDAVKQSPIQRVQSIAQWGIALAAIATIGLVVAATGPILLGWNTYVVVSGSMEPSIPVGSSVVTDKVHWATLKQSDVITFVQRNNDVVTHRIIEVLDDASGPGFKTRGDANKAEDLEIVRPVNILGKVLYNVPLAGYIIFYTNQPLTRLGILVVAIIIAGSQMQWWAFKKNATATPVPATAGTPAPAVASAASAEAAAPAQPATDPAPEPRSDTSR